VLAASRAHGRITGASHRQANPRQHRKIPAMNLFEYALRAYNLLFDLVLLILSPFVGPLRYVFLVGFILVVGLGWFAYVLIRRRRRPPAK
jgi:hypothetical protein